MAAGKKEEKKKDKKEKKEKPENNEKKRVEVPAYRGKLTIGQRAADKLTTFAGSWTFIILFFLFLGLWMATNTAWIIFGKGWDKYPFILLNLILSCLAAIQAPIILMSQIRQAQRDRLRTEYDYQVDKKSEKGIREVRKQLNRIEERLNKRK